MWGCVILNAGNVPPWLQTLWSELTKPPAILRQEHQERTVEDKESMPESQADPMDNAKRVARQFFAVDHQPASRPRPKSTKSIKSGAPYKKAHFHSKIQKNPLKKPLPSVVRESQANPETANIVRPSGSHQNGAMMRNTAYAPPKEINPEISQPLEATIHSAYKEDIAHIHRVQGIWQIETSSGNLYALKKTRLNRARILFLADTLDQLREKGFAYGTRILRTQQGLPYVVENGATYYASEWLIGEPVRLTSTRQAGSCAKTLAKLYERSLDIISNKNSVIPGTFDVNADLEAKKKALLYSLHRTSHTSIAKDIEHTIAEHATRLEADAGRALSLLQSSDARITLNRFKQKPGLCYFNVTSKHLLLHPSGFIQLADFEEMRYSPRVVDLAHLIRHIMQESGTWSNVTLLAPLIAYNRTRPLSQGDYLILQAMLTFPFRIENLLYQYVNQGDVSLSSREQWLKTFRQAIFQEESRHEFLNEFAKKVTHQA